MRGAQVLAHPQASGKALIDHRRQQSLQLPPVEASPFGARDFRVLQHPRLVSVTVANCRWSDAGVLAPTCERGVEPLLKPLDQAIESTASFESSTRYQINLLQKWTDARVGKVHLPIHIPVLTAGISTSAVPVELSDYGASWEHLR